MVKVHLSTKADNVPVQWSAVEEYLWKLTIPLEAGNDSEAYSKARYVLYPEVCTLHSKTDDINNIQACLIVRCNCILGTGHDLPPHGAPPSGERDCTCTVQLWKTDCTTHQLCSKGILYNWPCL